MTRTLPPPQVRFRDNEEWSELSKGRQSGGEMSVTTAIYMLALQELTTVPFRCVDEINQGLDERNERRVWDMILNAATEGKGSQYFYLAPKMPYSLQYKPGTVVHVCHASDSIARGLSGQPEAEDQQGLLCRLVGRDNLEKTSEDFDMDDMMISKAAGKQSKDVIPALIPVRKWREKGANLQVGDICAMISKDKHKTEFRLVKVLEVFPDLDNLVRTVRIGYRRRDGRERGQNYKAKALTEELVAVQRLAILVPVNSSE